MLTVIAILLHGNESGWPDQTVWIRPDPDPTGSWKNTGYPARSRSGSRSGAPL